MALSSFFMLICR